MIFHTTAGRLTPMLVKHGMFDLEHSAWLVEHSKYDLKLVIFDLENTTWQI